MKRTRRNASSQTTAALPSAGHTSSPEGREPRGTRRRRETRDKLLDAAFQLMAERGADAVTISQITEAADVAIGSFYNHFESIDALYTVVINQLFEDFADMLDQLLKDVEDPAEVVAASVRHAVLRAGREPLWARFLLREGLTARVLSRGLGVRLLRDIQKGMAKGRFKTPDLLMSFVVVGSGVLGAMAAELEFTSQTAVLQALGLDAQNVPERAAAVLLHSLGLSLEEAQRIAQLPLPAVDPPIPPA